MRGIASVAVDISARTQAQQLLAWEKTALESINRTAPLGTVLDGLMLSLEGTGSRMNRLAKDELYGGRYITLPEMIKGIDAVTADDLLRVATTCLAPDTMALTVLGPMQRRDLPSSF